MIPLSEPYIKGNEWRYIKECLDTGWVSSAGRYVDLFEQKICEYTGAKNAVACVNGTAALQISLLLAGVKPGDEVIAPTLTFIAPINAIQYLYGYPVFMDSDEYYNIDIEKTIQFIKTETRFRNGVTINKSTGRIIRAVIPVHIFGNAVDLESLLGIGHERNIKIIEDATESLGTKYIKGSIKNKHTGTIGDIGCLSFNGNKLITTGGGGMILTDSSRIAEKARYLTTQAKDDPLRYIHNEVGYNFRLTNLQSALGVGQLEQLLTFLELKEKTYQIYKDRIRNILGLHIAGTPDYADNNHWMVALQIDSELYGRDRENLMICLSRFGIQTRPIWYLNHLQKPYLNCYNYSIENALKLHKNTLNIPCSTGITKQQINYIIEKLNNGL